MHNQSEAQGGYIIQGHRGKPEFKPRPPDSNLNARFTILLCHWMIKTKSKNKQHYGFAPFSTWEADGVANHLLSQNMPWCWVHDSPPQDIILI